MTKSETPPRPPRPPRPPSPPSPQSPPSPENQNSITPRSEKFNNWASGIAALLSVVIAVISFRLNAKVSNFDRDLKNLEANRELSELVGTSIQHLISTDKKLQRDLAVLAITSALANKDIPDHHNLLLGYRLTRRLALTTMNDIKNLEEGKLPDLNNQEDQKEQAPTINTDLLNIVYEKNAETAYRLDEIIENYTDEVKTKLKKTRCDLAKELEKEDQSFKCGDEFTYLKEARELRKGNDTVDKFASSTISGNEEEEKTQYQWEANNLAREALSTILDFSQKEVLVNVYSDSNSDKTQIVKSAFSQNDMWLVPNQIVQTQVPENATSAVVYYGEENQHFADDLLSHLKKNLDSDTQKSIDPIKMIDASERLKQKAEEKEIDIRVPEKQLELWLVTEETTEEEENSTEIK